VEEYGPVRVGYEIPGIGVEAGLGQADDRRGILIDPRPVKRRVAEGEDAAIPADQPVALARSGRDNADDGSNRMIASADPCDAASPKL
jgi:hypothetical protein